MRFLLLFAAAFTLAAASTRSKATPDREKLAANVTSAQTVGKIAAEAAIAKGIKAVVFDRQNVFVGTFNLDPRSAQLNTEIGLLVESPVLSDQVAKYIESGMQPDHSWHVQRGKPGTDEVKSRSGRLYWSAGDPANPTVTRKEPEAGFMSRVMMRVLTWLPIDQWL